MARGSMMCGNFVTVSVPTALFVCTVAFIIIGAACLGVGVSMDCYWNDYSYFCWNREDSLVISGITFLSLAGALLIPAIVLISIICCCPRERAGQTPGHAYVTGTIPYNGAYPGSMAYAGAYPSAFPNNNALLMIPGQTAGISGAGQQMYQCIMVPVPQGAQTNVGYQVTPNPAAATTISASAGTFTNSPAYSEAAKETLAPVHM